jgi:hypothetical protein
MHAIARNRRHRLPHRWFSDEHAPPECKRETTAWIAGLRAAPPVTLDVVSTDCLVESSIRLTAMYVWIPRESRGLDGRHAVSSVGRRCVAWLTTIASVVVDDTL